VLTTAATRPAGRAGVPSRRPADRRSNIDSYISRRDRPTAVLARDVGRRRRSSPPPSVSAARDTDGIDKAVDRFQSWTAGRRLAEKNPATVCRRRNET